METITIDANQVQELSSKLVEWISFYGIKVLAALAIVIFGRWIAKLVRNIMRRMMKKNNVDDAVVSFVSSVTYNALLAFVIIAALGQMGIQTASFVAVLGAAGLAVGMALQGSLSNFASGLMMIIFKPFHVGDFVEFAGGANGTIEEISIFTTALKSPDGKKIIVPNSKITSDVITNYSAKPERRVDIIASVSYRDDLDKVQRVLERIVKEDSRILAEPAPAIVVAELGSSSVNFAVRPWVKNSDYWDVLFSLNEKIKKTFDQEGISIPFPQQDVHIYQEEKK